MVFITKVVLTLFKSIHMAEHIASFLYYVDIFFSVYSIKLCFQPSFNHFHRAYCKVECPDFYIILCNILNPEHVPVYFKNILKYKPHILLSIVHIKIISSLYCKCISRSVHWKIIILKQCCKKIDYERVWKISWNDC